ncbi:hypothetical protein AOQ84DRAFT_60192 [Glonium stellatum]|uniref:Uncharacterized protein n=1 Tax=Glonium stellatum TaxID=574774 RepID=A0A8E2EYP8_9PEZI|nr:hypothetical protein AOQ84DRAFT_60192 [Glonium stellatum]
MLDANQHNQQPRRPSNTILVRLIKVFGDRQPAYPAPIFQKWRILPFAGICESCKVQADHGPAAREKRLSSDSDCFPLSANGCWRGSLEVEAGGATCGRTKVQEATECSLVTPSIEFRAACFFFTASRASLRWNCTKITGTAPAVDPQQRHWWEVKMSGLRVKGCAAEPEAVLASCSLVACG